MCIIVITVFIHSKITQAPAHTNKSTIHNLTYSQLKHIANRDLTWRKIPAQSGKYARFIVFEKKKKIEIRWTDSIFSKLGFYRLFGIFCTFAIFDEFVRLFDIALWWYRSSDDSVSNLCTDLGYTLRDWIERIWAFSRA